MKDLETKMIPTKELETFLNSGWTTGRLYGIHSDARWKIVAEDGVELLVYNLKAFCREKGASFSSLKKGFTSLGYKARRLNSR